MREELTGEPGREVAVIVDYDDADTREIAGLDEVMGKVARQLSAWVTEMNKIEETETITSRKAFTDTKSTLGQMKIAKEIAGQDDMVGDALEATEGLALQGVKWESKDPIVADVFNQMAAEQNLDALVRKCWRETETISQIVLAFWWTEGTFPVRGKTEAGQRRKAKRTVYYPRKITALDSSRILPVGSLLFGAERLAWIPSPQELEAYRAHLKGGGEDEVMDRFYAGFYQPTESEKAQLLDEQGKATYLGYSGKLEDLILLNDENVRRYTLTRADYDRWAPVRLRGVFPLIDMKAKLQAADRVALIGAANYILLVKKGDKERPAVQEEVDNLKANFKMLARIPVIFSDHRLEIEIITPKQDFTLQREKYDLIDQRIMMRVLNGLLDPSGIESQSGNISLGKWTSLSLQGRRHMIKRFLEKTLAREVVNHPKNEGVEFPEGAPSLSYFPAKIMLESEATLGQQILSMRTQRDLSRESSLEFFGFDQASEAMRMAFEAGEYDDIFKTAIPFSANGGQPGGGAPPATQGPAGNGGGRPQGGGTPSQSPTKTQRTDNGTTSTRS